MKTSFINRASLGLISLLAGVQLSARTLGHGTLSGSLRDGDTHEPIPYTHVVLLRADTRQVAAVGTTDAAGYFGFRNVPLGRYVVQPAVLGYRAVRPAVALRPLHTQQRLGALTLQSLPSQPVVTGARRVAPPKPQPVLLVTAGVAAGRRS